MASSKSSQKKRNSKLKRPYTLYFFSLITLFVGFAFVFWASSRFFQSFSKLQLKDSRQKIAAHPEKPSKIYIPDLNEVLPITDGTNEGNRWVIAEVGISYLITSGTPGQNGNAVLYGHNKDDVLGRLYAVGQKEPIYVITNNGSYYKYAVSEKKEVTPQQVEILNPTTDSTLTIYTCSGFLDEARFVVVSKLSESIRTN